MTAPDDQITVTLRRDEWGRVLFAMRAARRKSRKDVARPDFDPVLGEGAIRRREAYEQILPAMVRQIGDADPGD